MNILQSKIVTVAFLPNLWNLFIQLLFYQDLVKQFPVELYSLNLTELLETTTEDWWIGKEKTEEGKQKLSRKTAEKTEKTQYKNFGSIFNLALQEVQLRKQYKTWGHVVQQGRLRRNSIKLWTQLQIHFAQGRFNWGTLRCSYGIVQLKSSWEFGSVWCW